MPEDVETGGQPQLRRGVSKTGRMAEFGCAAGGKSGVQGLQGLESGFEGRIMCMGVSRRPPSAAWPQLSGWRRYRRRSGVAVATGVVALLHVVAGAPFVRCHLFEPRPRPYCRESIGLQRQVLDTTAHCHAPGSIEN